MTKSTPLDRIVDQLHSLSPSDFTAARNAKVREARAAGDRELADTLRRIHKPTVSAWLANLLIREYPREVAELVALGASLREAQSTFDGKALRLLSEQRHDKVGGLSRDARKLAEQQGQRVSDAVVRQLEGTLEAGLFDADAAEQLQRGRLTSALSYSGTGFTSSPSTLVASGVPGALQPTGTSRAPAGPPRHGATVRTSKQERERYRLGGSGTKEALIAPTLRQAELDARIARKTADRAAAALRNAERASERARSALSAAEVELKLRREAAQTARRVVVRARTDRDAAEQAARAAERRLGGGRTSVANGSEGRATS